MGKTEMLAVAVGKKQEVVDALERNLGPHDQAWVVCGFDDCAHFTKGRCEIYMVHNVPKMLPGTPCGSYRKSES